MIRTPLLAAFAVLLSTAAVAQNDASSRIRPITVPIKDAGTYHMATGTWTRAKSPTANLGPDTIYNNTCFPGYYVALSSVETLVDSGRLPSTSSADFVGTADSYTVNGFQVAYCASNPSVDLDVAHYECYSPCADATALTPVSALSISGLPGGASGLACWILNIDLQGSTFEFDMNGDCDGSNGGSSGADNFGWSQTETNPQGAPGGPLLAGDPLGLLGANGGTGCPHGDGTVFVGQDISTQGTGIGAEDVFETDIGGAYGGCWWFGGYTGGAPFSSFGHGMYGDAGGGSPGVGSAYCSGDGSGTACPCSNNSTNGGGCANGSGEGAVLSGSGSNSAGASDLVLNASNCMSGQPGLFFQGDNAVNSGNGIAFGDGLRCAGMNVVRLEVASPDASGNASTTIDIIAKGGAVAGDVKRYQIWYRDPASTPCGSTFNLSNGVEVTFGA